MNYIILPNSLVLNHEGTTTTIIKDDGRYAQVLEKIKEGKLDEIIPLLSISKGLEDKGFEVKHGLVYIEGEALPTALSQRVLDFYNEGLPFEPLLKFWSKLKANPSFNSRQMLFKFLEHNGHPITTEGNFIAYRAVTSDYKDKHTGTMDNSIGNVVEIPRSQVDDNPNNTCSHGLHVATMCYAKSFGSTIVDVEIDPVDVVAVPTDYNGTKMRVCKFKVVADTKGIITGALVDSSYERDDDYDDESHRDYNSDEWFECHNCGHTNEEDASYCSSCGSTL
jgi:hypothetical protein